jgi:hypothetical protein
MAMALILSLAQTTFSSLLLGPLSVSSQPAGVVRIYSYLFKLSPTKTLLYLAFLFNIVATGQMYVWAVKKHKAYKKEFKDYPRNRTAMFPFIA